MPVRVLNANDLSETLELRLEVLPVLSFSRFLADEGTDLSQKDNVTALACGNFVKRSIRVRSGAASTNQDLNRVRQESQISLNSRNYYCDQNLHRVAIATVQQVADRTFYRRENRWVDARIVDREKTVQPRRTVRFGTTESHALLKRLTAEGRQGCVLLRGEIVLEIDGEPVLVTPEGALEEHRECDGRTRRGWALVVVLVIVLVRPSRAGVEIEHEEEDDDDDDDKNPTITFERQHLDLGVFILPVWARLPRGPRHRPQYRRRTNRGGNRPPPPR